MMSRQDHFLISGTELDRLKALSEAFHFTLLEFIESRRIKVHDDEGENKEFQELNSIIEEIEYFSEKKTDF